MTASNPEPVSKDRSGRPYIVGTTIVVVLLALILLLQEGLEGGTKAYVIGQVFGFFIGAALIAAIIYRIARFFNKTKPASRSAKITFWISLVWFVLLLLHFVGRVTNPRYISRAAITQQERQGLQVDADSIRHQSLGFVLPHPGSGFVRAEDAEQAAMKSMGSKPDVMAWIFRDSAQRKVLSIMVTTFLSLDEGKFRQFATGMKKAVPPEVFASDSVTWNRDRHEYRLALRHPNGMFSSSRCVPRLKDGGELIVCAQMVGLDSVGLDSIPNGLTVEQ